MARQGEMPYRGLSILFTACVAVDIIAACSADDFFFLAGRTCSAVCAWLSGVLILRWPAGFRWPDARTAARDPGPSGVDGGVFSRSIFHYTYFQRVESRAAGVADAGSDPCPLPRGADGAGGMVRLSGALIGLAMGTRVTFLIRWTAVFDHGGLAPDVESPPARGLGCSAFGGVGAGLLPDCLAGAGTGGIFGSDNFVTTGRSIRVREMNQGRRSPNRRKLLSC